MKRSAAALILVVALIAPTAVTPPPLSAQEAPAEAGGAFSPFTLEEVLSYAYAYPAAAAEDAPRIAWKVYEEGVRNLWTAEAPGFEPVRLTSYTEDDGQNLDDLVLTPDGATLIYVRGNGRNQAGEHANPSSHPDGAEQTIWAVATDGSSEPRKLATGSGPVLSPDGTRLIFARGGTVHELPVSGTWPEGEDDGGGGEGDDEAEPGDAKPRELFQARGTAAALRWSPDGGRIAFTSWRGHYAFLGVYDREADAIRWVSPSVDIDDAATWSPDGRRIAFLRARSQRAGQPYDLTAGVHFSVRVATLEPGDGPYPSRELWSSPPAEPGKEAGGFAYYYPTVPLRWVAPGGRDRILFTSEHTGWLHVHSIAADGPAGQEAVDLTPGACESEASAATADGRTLVFSANCGDLSNGDRRHLWRISTEGGTPVAVTSGDGIETDPVIFPAGGDGEGGGGELLAFRSAGARRPQAMAVARLDGSDLRVLGPEPPDSFPAGELVVPEPVVFQAADGLTIHAQVFVPNGSMAGGAPTGVGRPAAIFLHGGPIRQMLLGFHYSDYYARAYAMNQYLASRGYVVLALNFRAGIGYGRDFRRAPGQGPRGATEYQDVLAAAGYLRGRPDVDPERIGLWGGSYGGYLTALGLARDSDLFAAGVDLHGVHDWALRATDFLEGGGWGLTEELLEEARSSSPVADLTGWTSPVLMIHGDDDRNVLFLQTTDRVQRLREREVETEILGLPDEVHGFLRHASWLAAFGAADRFFEKNLLRPAPAPEVAD
jgi:dipeptidyl aminopeptidase/acylaminoacyl peptidase